MFRVTLGDGRTIVLLGGSAFEKRCAMSLENDVVRWCDEHQGLKVDVDQAAVTIELLRCKHCNFFIDPEARAAMSDAAFRKRHAR